MEKNETDQQIARLEKLRRLVMKTVRHNFNIIVLDSVTKEPIKNPFDDSILRNYHLIYDINYRLYLLRSGMGERLPLTEGFSESFKKSLLYDTGNP